MYYDRISPYFFGGIRSLTSATQKCCLRHNQYVCQFHGADPQGVASHQRFWVFQKVIVYPEQPADVPAQLFFTHSAEQYSKEAWRQMF